MPLRLHRYEAYKAATRIEQRGAEVARLREALAIARKPLDALSPDWPILADFIRAHEVVEAALSTPADDWLERHDGEVRREEREKCIRILDDLVTAIDAVCEDDRNEAHWYNLTDACANAAAFMQEESPE